MRRTPSMGTGVVPPVTRMRRPFSGERETARATSATRTPSSGRLCLPYASRGGMTRAPSPWSLCRDSTRMRLCSEPCMVGATSTAVRPRSSRPSAEAAADVTTPSAMPAAILLMEL